MSNNYDKYLIVDLPFEDNLNDKCGNQWVYQRSPSITDCSLILDQNNKVLFTKALYLNRSSQMYSKNSYNFFRKDFSLDFYMVDNNDYTGWGRNLLAIRSNNPEITMNETNITACYVSSIGNGLGIGFSNANGYNRTFIGDYAFKAVYTGEGYIYNFKKIEKFSKNEMDKKWHRITYCYTVNNKTIYIFIDNELVSEAIIKLPLTDYSYYIWIGFSFIDFQTCNWTGYIKNFKIYDGIAIYNDPNFNRSYTYLSNIDIDQYSNTKRLFSFNYDYNTYRKTKWNQKTNMYIMDPNIYNKKR